MLTSYDISDGDERTKILRLTISDIGTDPIFQRFSTFREMKIDSANKSKSAGNEPEMGAAAPVTERTRRIRILNLWKVLCGVEYLELLKPLLLSK